jgi:hypothetical protein
MLQFGLQLLLKVLTSEATKTLIAIGVNKLLEHKKDGITSDIAQVMIDGIAKSKANPTTADVFKDAVSLIKE